MPQPYHLVPSLPGMEMQTVRRVEDNSYIPFDPANLDFVAYQAWLADGNEPDPAPTADGATGQ